MAAIPPTSEMPITLRLSDAARKKLAELAAASGQDVAHYASDLIEEAITRPTIDEILAPVRDDFAKSGLGEDEIMELGRRELEALRQEKRAKSA
jgi:predicted transcriptional regulator